MLYLANPEYLYLLILALLFLPGYGVLRYLRKRRILKFGDSRAMDFIMPSSSKSKGWVRAVLFTLAFSSFVIGLSRPQIGAKLSEHKLKGVEVMICLDVSNSMLAQDYSPCRLDRAKLAISRLVDKLEDDRIGLIVFAGESFVQLPITNDYVSAKMFLGNVSTESVPVQGTAIGSAIRMAARSFSTQSEKSRAIIVITDGENHEDDAVEAAKDAATVGARVFTVGVGSPEGKLIPMGDDFLKDKDGNNVVTRLDENTLQEVAEAGNGVYVRAGNTEFGLNAIIDGIREMDEEEFSSVVFEEFDEQYMYFFAAALVLFIIEMLIGNRRHAFSLFKKK